jgi:Amt family ammonium transporter
MGAWPDQTLAAACSQSKQSSAQRFAIAGTAFGSNESGIFEVGYGIPVRGGTLDFDGFYNKVDDPCGAISVHGFCGWFGAVAVGIFADGAYGAGWNGIGAASYLGTAGKGVTGLLHGDVSQFLAQLGGATLCAVYAFGFTFLVFSAVKAVRSIRVSREVELEGLDVPEFGMEAYPEGGEQVSLA